MKGNEKITALLNEFLALQPQNRARTASRPEIFLAGSVAIGAAVAVWELHETVMDIPVLLG